MANESRARRGNARPRCFLPSLLHPFVFEDDVTQSRLPMQRVQFLGLRFGAHLHGRYPSLESDGRQGAPPSKSPPPHTAVECRRCRGDRSQCPSIAICARNPQFLPQIVRPLGQIRHLLRRLAGRKGARVGRYIHVIELPRGGVLQPQDAVRTNWERGSCRPNPRASE